jgi:hypothetical protein
VGRVLPQPSYVTSASYTLATEGAYTKWLFFLTRWPFLANFREARKVEAQSPRTLLLGSPVNKGKMKGQGIVAPAPSGALGTLLALYLKDANLVPLHGRYRSPASLR